MNAAGNVFVTGYFEDNVTFSSTTLAAGAAITQRRALFVGKLNTAGTWQWATKFGVGVDTRQPRTTTVGLTLAPDGDVLLDGTFNNAAYRGTVSFAFGSILLSTTGQYARRVCGAPQPHRGHVARPSRPVTPASTVQRPLPPMRPATLSSPASSAARWHSAASR